MTDESRNLSVAAQQKKRPVKLNCSWCNQSTTSWWVSGFITRWRRSDHWWWTLRRADESPSAAVQASITESDAAQLLPQRLGPAAPHALCPPLPCNQSPGWLAPYCKTPGLNCVTTAQCLRLTAQLCSRACEMQPLRVAVLGSVQRGDLCSDHPSSLCCRTPTEDVPSVSSSSKWTKSRLSGSQRVKMFVFQMAPEVLTPQSTATVRQPMQWANIVSPPGPAAMASSHGQQPWQRREPQEEGMAGPLAPCQTFVCLLRLPKEGTEVPQLLLRAAGCCETLGLMLIRRVWIPQT